MTTHNNSSTINKVALDGQSLTLSELRAISQRQLEVEISEAVYTKITLSNEILDERIQKGMQMFLFHTLGLRIQENVEDNFLLLTIPSYATNYNYSIFIVISI